MKKVVLLSVLILFLTSCTSIKDSSLDVIINNSLNSKVTSTNISKLGYSYYLPLGISVKESSEFNEVLTDQKYYYYLYVDIVSFHHKTEFKYNKNTKSYYSSKLNKNDKIGYIEINNYKNNQYLIEIMYNYAKIEMIVYESDINISVAYAMSILSSVTYNDNVIENYLGNNVLDSIEEEFNIFEIIGSENYLEFKTEEKEAKKENDPDYVN